MQIHYYIWESNIAYQGQMSSRTFLCIQRKGQSKRGTQSGKFIVAQWLRLRLEEEVLGSKSHLDNYKLGVSGQVPQLSEPQFPS